MIYVMFLKFMNLSLYHCLSKVVCHVNFVILFFFSMPIAHFSMYRHGRVSQFVIAYRRCERIVTACPTRLLCAHEIIIVTIIGMLLFGSRDIRLS